MRKLATVETISAIKPHTNADSLELATVRGWQIVVKRGEFKPGDRCVFVEIDSVLPERPEFEFMRERKFRVRTARLRGELSQGICFPMSILGGFVPGDNSPWATGYDVTDALGVTLYQPPVPTHLGGDVEGPFPAFIPKTDCERLQNNSWILTDLDDIEWVATEKVDGSSCTIFWKDDRLHVCSRNWEMKDDDNNAYWQAAKLSGLTFNLKDSPFALQGELLGPKIQGNRYGLKRPTLFFFDAYDMERRQYVNFEDFKMACDHLDLETVPLIARRTKLKGRSMEMMLQEAEDKSELHESAKREGLVWKPMIEMTDSRIGRVAFKAISNKFLLKSKD